MTLVRNLRSMKQASFNAPSLFQRPKLSQLISLASEFTSLFLFWRCPVQPCNTFQSIAPCLSFFSSLLSLAHLACLLRPPTQLAHAQTAWLLYLQRSTLGQQGRHLRHIAGSAINLRCVFELHAHCTAALGPACSRTAHQHSMPQHVACGVCGMPVTDTPLKTHAAICPSLPPSTCLRQHLLLLYSQHRLPPPQPCGLVASLWGAVRAARGARGRSRWTRTESQSCAWVAISSWLMQCGQAGLGREPSYQRDARLAKQCPAYLCVFHFHSIIRRFHFHVCAPHFESLTRGRSPPYVCVKMLQLQRPPS